MQYNCPDGSNYDPGSSNVPGSGTCRLSLASLAAQQQAMVGKVSLGNSVMPSPLMMGNQSGLASPLSAPWVSMPDGGFPFFSNGTITTPAANSVWTDVIGPAGQYPMQVPNGNDGVINTVMNTYNGAGFVVGSGSLVWRILINGQAARNFDNILVPLGVAPFPSSIAGIRVSSGDTVQFQVKNVSLGGAATQIICFLSGWYYSNKMS